MILIGMLKALILTSGLKGKLLASFKNVNYETKNVSIYKEDKTSEFSQRLDI